MHHVAASVGPVISKFCWRPIHSPCASRSSYLRCDDCVDEERCSVRLMMLEVRDAIATVLDQCTLADMRARSAVGTAALVYHI